MMSSSMESTQINKQLPSSTKEFKVLYLYQHNTKEKEVWIGVSLKDWKYNVICYKDVQDWNKLVLCIEISEPVQFTIPKNIKDIYLEVCSQPEVSVDSQMMIFWLLWGSRIKIKAKYNN